MGTVFSATAKSADAPDIEADIYDAKFLGVSTKFVTGGQYGDGDRFSWLFALLDEDGTELYDKGEPVELDALTSLSLNTVSKTTPKAVRYIKALATDEEFAQFEEGGLDMDTLIGRIAQVEVTIRDNGWPTIVNVLPKRARRRTSRAAAE